MTDESTPVATATTAPEPASAPLGGESVSAAASTVEPPAAPKQQGHVLSDSAFKNIKDTARKRGRKDGLEAGRAEGLQMATDQIAEAAKAAGFDSVEGAFAALAKLKAPAPAPAAPAAPPEAPAFDEAAMRASIEAEYAARFAEATARTAALEESLTAKDAEIAIRDTLAKAGVHDTDYAATLLSRELASMDDDALAAFDDAAWVDSQRTSRPYLFGGQVAPKKAPANTGVTEGTNGASPQQVAVATAGAGNFDGRTAKTQDFRARLAAMGLNPPGFGTRA